MLLHGLLDTPINALSIIEKGVRIQGNNAGLVADLAAAIAANCLVPVVGHVFAMGEAAEAYAHLAAGGKHFAKSLSA